ncbi:MAG: protein kinase domain-containing protein [Gemmataceae bacterium]
MSQHLPAGTKPQTDDELEALVAQFLAQLQAGENPDREALIRAHPNVADRLKARLALAEMVYRVGLAPVEEWPSAGENVDWPNSTSGLHARPTRRADANEEGRPAQGLPSNPPDYEILGELGHGGMGVVYKARQLRLNRIVALKMIRAGVHASPELLARFHIEAETLAKLQHPNIVQIYEVGEYTGCPYIAMEFVDGGSLHDLLANNQAPPRAAAELTETLARAMHAAHLRGIVHRDLKPANILIRKAEHSNSKSQNSPIEGFGFNVSAFTPKVTDFGLAKHLAENKGHTATGEVVGTPNYMAPEQASGRLRDIGPPTDVYALGAILYELLTGRPPFEGQGGMDTLRRVLSEEPPAPSRLRPKLPRDLETICLKCLEKEPAKRYQTAENLADDLRRFLNREPITARPSGVSERFLKWVRRRPLWAALIGVVIGASGLMIVNSAWSYSQVVKERDRARTSLQVARRTIDDLYIKMASERFFDEPQLDPLYQGLLEKARILYEELGQEHSDDPEVRRDIAMAWFHLGDIHRLHGHHDKAEEAYVEAIARQEDLCRAYPNDPRVKHDLATSHNWLGELLREHGRPPEEAELHYRAALDLQDSLVATDAMDANYRKDLARSHYNLGIIERETDRLAQAREDYDQAVELLTQLHGSRLAERNCQEDLARALVNRGILHRQDGRPDEAEKDYGNAIGLLTRLHDEIPSRAAYKLELAIAKQNRGNLLLSQGGQIQALEEHRGALTLLRQLTSDFSSRPHYQKKKGIVLKNLGAALAPFAKDRLEAEKYLNQARTIFETLTKEAPDIFDYQALLGMTLGNLGWLRTEEKNWSEARRLIEEGIEHMQVSLRPNPKHPDYRQELRNQYQDLAWTLVQLGDHVAAAQAAKNLASVYSNRALDNYYGACFIARCIPLTKDSQLSAQYVEQAVECLRTATQRATPSLTRIPDEVQVFEPLRTHPDFNGLLSQLDAKTKK